MIASAIAYFVTALFFVMGIATLAANLRAEKMPAEQTRILFAVSVAFFAAAWGCAYLGGI